MSFLLVSPVSRTAVDVEWLIDIGWKNDKLKFRNLGLSGHLGLIMWSEVSRQIYRRGFFCTMIPVYQFFKGSLLGPRNGASLCPRWSLPGEWDQKDTWWPHRKDGPSVCAISVQFWWSHNLGSISLRLFLRKGSKIDQPESESLLDFLVIR